MTGSDAVATSRRPGSSGGRKRSWNVRVGIAAPDTEPEGAGVRDTESAGARGVAAGTDSFECKGC